jgi:hypothetical protein
MKAERESKQLKTSTLRLQMSKKYITGMDIQMIGSFMIHRSPIFANYHSNFWFLRILIIFSRGPAYR